MIDRLARRGLYAISAVDGLTVMAGLWSRWMDPKSGDEISSCTVLTCAPNDVMVEIHDRMPVIPAESDWPKWLGEKPASEDELLALLRPCSDDALKIWPVGKAVGNVKNTGPQLAVP
jgi:putative SOS response-associated peptidase YedK